MHEGRSKRCPVVLSQRLGTDLRVLLVQADRREGWAEGGLTDFEHAMTTDERAKQLAEEWRCDGVVPSRHDTLVGVRPEEEIAAILDLLVEARGHLETLAYMFDVEALIERIDEVVGT